MVICLKKYSALIILILILVFIRCQRKSKILEDNSIKILNNKIISGDDNLKYIINLPKIHQEEIDSYIEREVMNIFERIKENYQENTPYINIDYEHFNSNYALSLLFTVKINNKGRNVREIIYTYNFDIKNNQIITLNNNILSDVYLPIINERLHPYNLMINNNDLKILKYIINQENITFIIPKEITKRDVLQIAVTNLGDAHLLISESKEEPVNKYVSITIDDGPSIATIDLVNLLNKYNIKATFFFLGENVIKYPQAVKYVYDNNHEIGNHSYNHLDFSKIDISEIVSQINKTQESIYKIIQSYPKVFRFPYGKYNNFILNYIDLPIILWSCDSEDWNNTDESIIFSNVLKDLNTNSIILFHDFKNYRKEAIEKTIKYLIKENYKFVTISEFFNFECEENIVYGKIYW